MACELTELLAVLRPALLGSNPKPCRMPASVPLLGYELCEVCVQGIEYVLTWDCEEN